MLRHIQAPFLFGSLKWAPDKNPALSAGVLPTNVRNQGGVSTHKHAMTWRWKETEQSDIAN